MEYSQQLPQEIVFEIFRHISEDLPTLLSAILTCRAWSEAGNGYLWKHPPLHALAEVLPESRRQNHCQSVRHLDLETVNRVHLADLGQPQFPRLRKLSITEDQELLALVDDDGDDIWFQQLLQPTVTSFGCDYIVPKLRKNILDLISTRCPRLQHITLDNYEDMNISDQDFIQFLERLPFLRSVNLGSAPGGTDILTYLSARNNLDCLKLRRTIDTVDVEAVFEQTHHRSLLILETEEVEDNKITPTLVAKLTGLDQIGLGVVSPVGDSLYPLSKLTDLVSLSLNVKVEDGVSLSVREFDEIAQLKQLRRLEINVDDKDLVNFRAEWLDDQYFASWISNLSVLEHLTLRVKSKLSSASLIVLGKACRRLQGFEITGTFDVTDWQDSRYDEEDQMILFPELTLLGNKTPHRSSSLRLSSTTSEEETSSIPATSESSNDDEKSTPITPYDPQDIVNVVLHQAPKLERLYLDTLCRDESCLSPLSGYELQEQKRKDNFSRAVVLAFKNRSGRMYDS